MGNMCVEKKEEPPIYEKSQLSQTRKSDVQQNYIQQIEPQEECEEKQQKDPLSDYTLLKVLGRGSYGKVFLARKDSEYFAIKVIKKTKIKEDNLKSYIQNERLILEQSGGSFSVGLYQAFETHYQLFFVMDFCQGGKQGQNLSQKIGELTYHLRRAFKFDAKTTQFYTAELIIALSQLHQKGVIFRDLKPENVMLCHDGHLKISDFGLAKICDDINQINNDFVGTLEYLAPEIFLEKGHNCMCDWWSLVMNVFLTQSKGALMYEMLTGAAPFYSKDKTLMFRNRAEKPIEMKPEIDEVAFDLLKKLLHPNVNFLAPFFQTKPNNRIGRNLEELKSHPFFAEFNWKELENKQMKPPITLKFKSKTDVRYFNPVVHLLKKYLQMCIEEPPILSPVTPKQNFSDDYENFDFPQEKIQQ